MIDDPLNSAGVQGPKPFGEPVEDGLGTRNAERNILGHGLGKSPRLIHYIRGAPIRKSDPQSLLSVKSPGRNGGLEYAFTPNLSLKAEYLYLDLNRQHYNIPLDVDSGVSPGLDFGPLKVHTFKTGLNWRFNWGKTAAPVVARY